MRRILKASIAASVLTLWIDALLWTSGDAGPVGWLLAMAIPQLFLLPTVIVALVAVFRKAWHAAGLSLAVTAAQVFGPLGLCLGQPSSQPADLKVLSFNVGQFEALQWPETTLSTIASSIRKLDPDVACLQEAHYHGRLWFGDRLATELPKYYAFVKGGMVILSKRPIEERSARLFESHYGGHWNVQEVSVRVANQDVTFINVHMVPDGYEPPWWPKKPLLGQIERKRQLREEEFREIEKRVASANGPVVVCGDFNQQPFGPAYRRMSNLLTDSFRATNFGFGYTLTARQPTKRIDYVWTKGLKPLRSQVIPVEISDHRPLLTELALTNDRSE